MSRTVRDFARVTDPVLRQLLGTVRRMAISVTTKALWQLVGYENLDGTDETLQVEPFTGIGFYSRPPSTGKPEAIVVFVGSAKVPAVVAMRDERTRAAVAGSIEPDSAIVYSSAAAVYVRANGTVEIRTPNGAAVPLALASELNALRVWVAGHVHANHNVVPTVGVPAPLATNYPGTSVLRGQ